MCNKFELQVWEYCDYGFYFVNFLVELEEFFQGKKKNEMKDSFYNSYLKGMFWINEYFKCF